MVIAQSGSGTATGTLTMTGGTLAAASGPAFFVSNGAGAIVLSGATIAAGSGVLLEAAVTASLGTAGGTAQLTASGEALTGDLVTGDTSSTIAAVLTNSSSLTGAIGRAALTLDSSSTWTVTGDSAPHHPERPGIRLRHRHHQHHRQRPHRDLRQHRVRQRLAGRTQLHPAGRGPSAAGVTGLAGAFRQGWSGNGSPAPLAAREAAHFLSLSRCPGTMADLRSRFSLRRSFTSRL